MTSERRLCAGCLRDDEQNAAESWCVECQEEVCNPCSKAHKRLKPPHRVISLSEAGVFSSDLIKTYCTEHPDRKVSFYCTGHDVIICDSCLADDHKNCQNVLPLDKAAKNVRESFVFEDVHSRMRDLSVVLSKIKDVQTRHFSELDIEKMEEKVIKDISKLKEAIIRKLDRAEKESIHAIRNELKSFKENGKELIKDIIRHQKFVSECIKNVTELEKNASEPQFFQAVKMMDKRTHDIESSVQSRLSKTSHIEFHLNKDAQTFATSFDSFGSVDIAEKEIGMPMLKQVQVPISKSENKKFRLAHKFPTSQLKQGEQILKGCIDGDKLFLPSENDSSLYVCNHDGTDVKCISLRNKPCDVDIIDTKRAIVTIQVKGYHILDTESLTLTGLKKPACCYDVSYNNEQIYVRNGGKNITVMNEKGETQKEFTTLKDPLYIHCSCKGNFYYTTADDDEIHQVTSSGERTFFKHPDMRGPDGMASDDSGNLYVVGGFSCNVFKISENDQSHEIVLREDDGVRFARGMYFDKKLQRLLILNYKGEEVLIFQLD